MESALTPREIQAKIRAGESVAEVAQAAGVPEENIETYAGPVLAEREHIATMARSAPVRRRGEAASQRLLGDTVADTLAAAGIDAEQISWDAWRTEDRRWSIEVRWPSEDESAAHFEFDQRGRFSVAHDEAARMLIDERPPAASPAPGDPDAEPTVDLHDELAIVRVLQDDTEPPTVLPDVPAARIIKLPSRDEAPVDDGDEPDDYSDAELEQQGDGVYDIIPNPRSDMDVLYEMLAGFNEDSVRIYTGLTQPVSAPAQDPARQPQQSRPEQPRSGEPRPEQPTTQPERPKPHPPAVTPREPERPKPAEPVREPEPRREPEPQPQAAREPDPSPAQPEQDPLLAAPKPEQPAPKPKGRRKRAAVPSWDEIMFGGPTPKKD